MKKAIATLLFILGLFSGATTARAGEVVLDSMAHAKQHFVYARQELQAMLDDKKPLSYERAIFLMENAYYAGGIDSVAFRKMLDYHVDNIQTIIQSNRNAKGYAGELNWLERVEDKKAAYEKALTNWAIFSYLTEMRVYSKDNKMFVHYPYAYSTEDPMGSLNWRATQVANLLDTKRGNCFALASLFKILSDRLGSDANLCTVPGHIYITHENEQGTRFNVELTSGSFPGTGTLMTLSYTTKEAIQNNISLRDLSLKQSVALCLLYLGKGYEAKFGVKGDDFSLRCAEQTLRYDSLNLNAVLQKAAVIEERLIQQGQSVAELQDQKDFKTYEALLAKLYRLGYREMPLEMKNIILAGYKRDTLPYVTRNHTPKTFSQNGVQGTRYASLSWGLFDEMHESKPVERYGNTLFDTKAGKIAAFAKAEVLYNQYNFDPVAFAWNVDPLAHKAPQSSPYAFCEGNPILYLDPDGRFKRNYNEQTLREHGLTKLDVQRFENIIQNMGQLIANNPQALDAIANSTGFSRERIQQDFAPGNGPNINIAHIGGGAKGNAGRGITFDPIMLKSLASIDANDREQLATQVLAFALTTGHEYVHFGDETTNGVRTGQWALLGGRLVPNSESYNGMTPDDPGSRPLGSQHWKRSITGHRGTDFEVMGFGVNVLYDNSGKGYLRKGEVPSNISKEGLPSVPTSLPSNVQGEKVLETLRVQWNSRS